MLSPRTRAEDPAAVRMVRDCLVHTDRAKLGNAVISISLRRPDLSRVPPPVERSDTVQHRHRPPGLDSCASRSLQRAPSRRVRGGRARHGLPHATRGSNRDRATPTSVLGDPCRPNPTQLIATKLTNWRGTHQTAGQGITSDTGTLPIQAAPACPEPHWFVARSVEATSKPAARREKLSPFPTMARMPGLLPICSDSDCRRHVLWPERGRPGGKNGRASPGFFLLPVCTDAESLEQTRAVL